MVIVMRKERGDITVLAEKLEHGVGEEPSIA
jgi:hypothetical protein